MYLDDNNIQGWAMCQYLPTGGFKWLSEKAIYKIDLNKYTNDSKKELISEVDLEYPKEQHDRHNDDPVAAVEQVKVTENMMSEYCQKNNNKYGISIGQVHKLIPTLSNEYKYALHYRNLQLYLDLGLKLKKSTSSIRINQYP